MKKTAFLAFSLVLLFLIRPSPKAQEQPLFRVIAHPENPVTTLTRTQVSRILLKKVALWEDGTRAEPVDQGGKDEVRKVFTKEIHHRSVSSVRHYWQRQIFSGDGVPPPELASDREVVEFVRSHPGALGYVSFDVPLDGVKELIISE